MNETLHLIFKRSSCRDFDPTPLSHEDLKVIAKAGVAAPSGMNAQPWHIGVITDADIITELEVEGLANLKKTDIAGYTRIQLRGGTLFYHAPVIAVIWVRDSYKSGAELLDCGIVTQNIALAAQSLGIASCICGFANYAFVGERTAELTTKCRVPEGYRFGMSVLLGRADTAGTAHEPDEEKITFVG
ncbi:MAG: nitroreductase family protein [Oscillospiraceae bacterium]|jgi:nitroreductase|nr:nitroreductase family protein [Oscillospiraceae bacterium]